MPHYFFDLTNDIPTVVDADGVQLEDENAMRLEALEMVTNLSEEAHITGMTGAAGVTDWPAQV